MALQYISTILILITLGQIKQKDKGLVVVGGVHSPEFQFEKNYTNVKSATQTGITHPVIAAGMVRKSYHNYYQDLILLNSSKLTSHNS